MGAPLRHETALSGLGGLRRKLDSSLIGPNARPSPPLFASTTPPDAADNPLAPAPPGLEPASAAPARHRRRLHELEPSLHCSVIGTCLAVGELRKLLERALARPLDGSSDHAIHGEAVGLAARPGPAATALDKALCRKFASAIDRAAACRDEVALRGFWQAAREVGDIAGAYWAVLTHPVAARPGAGETLVREVFGEVHMLSHLVGASSRKGLERLVILSRENEELRARLSRHQHHTTSTLESKNARIRELESRLGAAAAAAAAPDATAHSVAAALAREQARAAKLEARIATLEARLARREDEARAMSAAALEALRGPAAEGGPPPCCAHPSTANEGRGETEARPAAANRLPPLDGATILLVGGRSAQLASLRRAVAGAGGRLLHHDGGVEMNLALLPGLCSRADRIVLALDSVSHAAAAVCRRAGRDLGTPLTPLAGLSLATFTKAMKALAAPA